MTQAPSKTHLRLHDARRQLTDNGVISAVDAVLEDLLPKEVAPPYSDKIIKDLVWGVITIPGFLIPLVDSRLFQRQRRIRQLGVSYLVYPGSGYGRFEHGLGCCHVMSLILRTVEDRGSKVSDRVRTQLLTGALLHDIGHLPFSHASERGLEQWLDRLLIGTINVRDIIKTLNKAMSLSLKPAEAISVLVILSGTFSSTIHKLTQSKHNDDNFCLELAAFLSGARLHNDQIAFSQVLSGAVDSDRLDYVARDSKVCGIPVSVDVGRLLHRCEFVSVPVNRLPESMRGMLTETSPAHVFVTDLSGANALEEMAMSRFVLYDRVYNHQKTQAAEGVLRELLDVSFEEGLISSQLLSFWKQNDEEFLYKAIDCPKTRPLAERLLYRDLPRRAVVYGFSLMKRTIVPFDAVPTDEPTDSVEHGAEKNISRGIDDVLIALDETVRVAERRRALVAKIIERARVLAAWVSANHRPKGELKSIFLAHRPDSPLQTLNSAYVMDPDGSVRLLQEHMPLQEWSNAFNVNKAFGYIFCDDEWQNIVHIAAEMVLWEDYSTDIGPFRFAFRVAPLARTRAKLSSELIDHIKGELDEHDAFRNCRPLRPLIVAPGRLDALETKFRQFQGANNWSVTREGVGEFLRQFPVALQDEMTSLLTDSLEFLGRTPLTKSLTQKILGLGIESTAIACLPLSKNSGAVAKMLVEADSKRQLANLNFSYSVLSVIPADIGAVVLVDDVISSGSQARCQLQAWCGVPRDQWVDPAEMNIDATALPPILLDALKTKPIRLVVARGFDDGVALVEALAKTLGFANFGIKVHESLSTTDLNSSLSKELVAYLRVVGEQLLAPTRGKDASTDALGYSGKTGVLASTFNVPTCCPAALWCPGTVNGTPWTPLFIRRGYEQRVRLS